MTIRAFVSSTYIDLKDHRTYVIDRLSHGGIIVDPMENWTAACDEPKELSQERMRDCDLCILLVGFRRGHIPGGEKLSITQMEYREALRRGIDVLVFMAQEDADWPVQYRAELEKDPEMRFWREELREHLAVKFFTPQPESVDVDAAILRWLGDQTDNSAKARRAAVEGDTFPIEIRAYSNSEAILIAWRTQQPIANCLGFALHRKLLGTASVTEDVVKTALGFTGANDASPGTLTPNTTQPIQNFRWADHPPDDQEARYRVVPIVGQPENLHETPDVHSGSGWTR
jgi:hypothetical protein